LKKPDILKIRKKETKMYTTFENRQKVEICDECFGSGYVEVLSSHNNSFSASCTNCENGFVYPEFNEDYNEKSQDVFSVEPNYVKDLSYGLCEEDIQYFIKMENGRV
jgi:hypothetical protein